MRPLNDPARLAGLRRSGLLESGAEEVFDRFTRLASQVLDAPVALISLVDDENQYFKSRVGLDVEQTPLSHSFCQYVVDDDGPLVVPDARADARLHDNPAIEELGVASYCGVPLRTAEGHVLGSFCVIGAGPRPWSERDLAILRELAAGVMTEVELRLANQALAAVEHRRRAMFQASLDALVETDMGGRILAWNPAAERIFGWAEEEVVGQPLVELIAPPGLRGRCRAEFAESVSLARSVGVSPGSTPPAPLQMEAITRGGALLHVEVALTPFDTEKGPELNAVIRDVTLRRTSELAASESGERKALMLAKLPGTIVCLYDRDLRVVDVQGEPVEGPLGERWRTVVGQDMREVADLQELKRVEEPLRRALSGEACAFEYVNDSGREYEVQATPFELKGGADGVLTVWHDVTGQRTLERLLTDAQELANLGSWELSAGAERAEWSDELCRIFGVALGTRPSYSEFLALVHPEDRARVGSLEPDHVGLVELTFRIVRPDGAVRWINSRRYVRRPSRTSALVDTFGAMQDITEAHDALEALRREREALSRSERRLRDITTAVPAGILRMDLRGRWLYVNDRFRELWGMTPDEPIDRYDWLARVHEDDRERVLAEWETARAAGGVYETEFRIRPADGDPRWTWTRAVAELDETGKQVGILATIVDVHERHETAKVLADSERRFRGIFEDAPIGMALITPGATISQGNKALDVITRRSPGQLEGMHLGELLQPHDVQRTLALLAAVGEGRREELDLEVGFLTAAGSPVAVSLHAIRLPAGEDGSNVLCQFQDISERKRYEAKLQFMADHDPLTGLLNRRKFEAELGRHVAHVRRYGPTGAVMVLDIDHFKQVNDTLGHHAGDELIVSVSAVLRGRLRESDVLGRLGGDEFAVLLPQATALEAQRVADDLVRAVREESRLPAGKRRNVTISLGVALFERARDAELITADSILAEADMAMYEAKESGRGRSALNSGGGRSGSRAETQTTWVKRIENALAADRFVLAAQPVLNLRTDQISQYELLVRMLDEDGEMILPASFLPVAERFNLAPRIDEWVVGQAIELVRANPYLHLEVNVAAGSLEDPRLLQAIESELSLTGVDPNRLIFEVSEATAVRSPGPAQAFAQRLNELGCRFALDGFGTGFGSFQHLKHLHVDYLKIDGAAVRPAVSEPIDRLVIDAVVRVARGLGKETISAFVGDAPTQRTVAGLGVDFAQGYHIAKPFPVRDLHKVESSRPPKPGTPEMATSSPGSWVIPGHVT